MIEGKEHNELARFSLPRVGCAYGCEEAGGPLISARCNLEPSLATIALFRAAGKKSIEPCRTIGGFLLLGVASESPCLGVSSVEFSCRSLTKENAPFKISFQFNNKDALNQG